MRKVLAHAKRFYLDVFGISRDRAGTEPFQHPKLNPLPSLGVINSTYTHLLESD